MKLSSKKKIGKKIENWVVNKKPELLDSLEFTHRACDIVKQKTNIDLPLVVTKMFVGVGSIIVNYHDKVFLIIIMVNIMLSERCHIYNIYCRFQVKELFILCLKMCTPPHHITLFRQ